MNCPVKRCNQEDPVHCDGACHGVMSDGSTVTKSTETVNKSQEGLVAEPTIPAYQQRVIDEKKDLDAKIERLNLFMHHNAAFDKLSDMEQSLMLSQAEIMADLSAVLEMRIQLFNKD